MTKIIVTKCDLLFFDKAFGLFMNQKMIILSQKQYLTSIVLQNIFAKLIKESIEKPTPGWGNHQFFFVYINMYICLFSLYRCNKKSHI
jgi:hypothetical protein